MCNVFSIAVNVTRDLHVALEVDCESDAFCFSYNATQLSPRGLYITPIFQIV